MPSAERPFDHRRKNRDDVELHCSTFVVRRSGDRQRPELGVQLEQPLRRVDHDPLRRRIDRRRKSSSTSGISTSPRAPSDHQPAAARRHLRRLARVPTSRPPRVSRLGSRQVVLVVTCPPAAAPAASTGTRSSSPASASASFIVSTPSNADDRPALMKPHGASRVSVSIAPRRRRTARRPA